MGGPLFLVLSLPESPHTFLTCPHKGGQCLLQELFRGFKFEGGFEGSGAVGPGLVTLHFGQCSSVAPNPCLKPEFSSMPSHG